MIEIVGSKRTVIWSGVLMGVMYVIVMFIVNPMIDGKTGLEVIKLQLAFSKDIGVNIINGWGSFGQQNFISYIFTDYIYAISYSLFLASLFSFFTVVSDKKRPFTNIVRNRPKVVSLSIS